MGLPTITPEFLATTIVKGVTNAVSNVRFPVMGGGAYLAEAAKAYSGLASNAQHSDKVAIAFNERAAANSTEISFDGNSKDITYNSSLPGLGGGNALS